MTPKSAWSVNRTTAPAPIEEPWVRIGRYLAPPRFTADFDHQELDGLQMVLEVDRTTRALRCVRLNVENQDAGVTGALLRQLPITSMMRAALTAASETQDGSLVEWDPADITRFDDSLKVQDPNARWALTREHLGEVADVYREALRVPGGRAPVLAVADHWNRSRATAARWVAAARAADPPLLGATSRGRAGEERSPE